MLHSTVGNTNTCTQTVTIEDHQAPYALCQNITIQLDANGDASITTADIDNGSNDDNKIDNNLNSNILVGNNIKIKKQSK